MRRFWLLVDRYASLLIAFFLVLVGLTGRILAARKQQASFTKVVVQPTGGTR